MSDLLQIGSVSGLSEIDHPRGGSSLSTGDLRRKYNFGSRVSELAIAQDPFFRLLSKVSKKATDDPEFKFTERRPSYHKRYAYVVNHGDAAQTSIAGGDATVSAGKVDAGDIYYVAMSCDYSSAGNIGNRIGQSSAHAVGDNANKKPGFFMEGQLVKIPYGASDATFSGGKISAVKDYLVGKIDEAPTSIDSGKGVNLKLKIVKGTSAAIELASYYAANDALDGKDISGMKVATELEPKRSYVVGSAHAQGSGYPQTWQDQPFSTANGLTQIWKTSLAMDNTTRATVLKYDASEWARLWREKLIEHKWDIETSLLFGSQYTLGTGGTKVQHTQGAVDYITSYGNIFDGSQMGGSGTKSQDEFLDDMSQFLDPRYNNSNATVFFVSTDVYNWLHKLGGYWSANVADASNGRSNFSVGSSKNVFGVAFTEIVTPYGSMKVARNVHLDGTPIKMLGINMRYCAYRPLVGNGLNRDTAIYVGVQSLENSGIDKRIDLIQTEAGMEWQMPEAHAVWK
tara:strand:+ start:41176 stop:42711 length:1536 start_codon:yes stop_codon:yes gene_type:complete